jgi:hypothetical protein
MMHTGLEDPDGFEIAGKLNGSLTNEDAAKSLALGAVDLDLDSGSTTPFRSKASSGVVESSPHVVEGVSRYFMSSNDSKTLEKPGTAPNSGKGAITTNTTYKYNVKEIVKDEFLLVHENFHQSFRVL